MKKMNQKGRSMVEMLGVLAIVGVLSVGAIAGYSKAMMKYKLNKHAQQIGFIMDYVIANQDKFKRPIGGGDDPSNFYTSVILKKLGVIPLEMFKGNNDMYIYDSFNNKISIENHTHQSSGSGGYSFNFQIDASDTSVEICRNLYAMAKARSQDISFAYAQRREQDDSLTNTTAYYGDAYKPTYTSQVRLRNMTMTDIDNACRVCSDTKQCNFHITLGYK